MYAIYQTVHESEYMPSAPMGYFEYDERRLYCDLLFKTRIEARWYIKNKCPSYLDLQVVEMPVFNMKEGK